MADQRVKLPHPSGVEVEIDEETLRRFESIPENKKGARAKVWTPKEDALLLKFWPTRNKVEVAEELGVNDTTARKRYRHLTQKQGNAEN